jgi:hypothetical protein
VTASLRLWGGPYQIGALQPWTTLLQEYIYSWQILWPGISEAFEKQRCLCCIAGVHDCRCSSEEARGASVLSARTSSLQTHPHDVQGSIEAMETPVESFFQTQKTEHAKHIQNARSSASLTSRGNPPLYRIHNSIWYRSSQLDHKSLAWVPGYHTSRCNILITSTRPLQQTPQK